MMHALRARPSICVFMLALFAGSLPAAAQSVRYLKYTPSVIVDSTTQVLLEVEITGTTPTRISVDFGPSSTASISLDARDDGTGGDRVAADRTYSVLLPAANIRTALRGDDVHKVFIGFLNLFANTTNVFRGNLFIDVYATDVGTYPIVQLSPFVQASTYVVNIVDPVYFQTLTSSHVTQEFYRWFADDYDVLNLIYEPMRFANRNHGTVKNQVRGIGETILDNAAAFGSAGLLQGISQFPIATFFDGAENGHIHELGHQWINFVNVVPFASGIPHWPKSSMAGGVMGFSLGGAGGQGGDFACTVVDDNGAIRLLARPDAPAFNDLDLYLMGLMPANEVRTQTVFADQNAVANLTCVGQTFTGPVVRVSAQDVINGLGPRNPAYGDAPNRFHLGTILVTRDGFATPEQMYLYSWLAQRGELRSRVAVHAGFSKELGQPFYVATGGRGTLDMRVDIGQPDFSLVPTPASQTVIAGSPASYSISAMPARSGFDAEVVFACGDLPAHARCTFAPDRVTPGTTGQDTVLTITTRDPGPSEGSSLPGAVAVVLASTWWTARRRSRPVRPGGVLFTGALVVLVGLAPGCAGGSGPPNRSPTPTPTPTPTPVTTTAPGTYAVTVTGTSAGTVHTTVVTLVVQ